MTIRLRNGEGAVQCSAPWPDYAPGIPFESTSMMQ